MSQFRNLWGWDNWRGAQTVPLLQWGTFDDDNMMAGVSCIPHVNEQLFECQPSAVITFNHPPIHMHAAWKYYTFYIMYIKNVTEIFTIMTGNKFPGIPQTWGHKHEVFQNEWLHQYYSLTFTELLQGDIQTTWNRPCQKYSYMFKCKIFNDLTVYMASRYDHWDGISWVSLKMLTFSSSLYFILYFLYTVD